MGEGWDGPIDEVRIYAWGLSAEEVRALYDDARIENPQPADAARDVTPGSTLSWIPAPSATHHDIYFGRDPVLVAAATPASPQYAGRRADPSYAPPLERGARYAWRVDEVRDGVPRRGEVRTFAMALAYTDFREPATNATSYSPPPTGREIGFRTTWRATGGANPYVGVTATGTTPTSPVFAHRSVDAETTFDWIDLSSRSAAAVSLILRVRDTGYETGDILRAYATDGAERSVLVEAAGSAIDALATGEYIALSAPIPAAWTRAALVLETSSNSGAGSEGFDIAYVEFIGSAPEATLFRRGDANADGRLDIADGVATLEHLFAGARTTCDDALDANDDGAKDIGDPVWLLNHLFAGGPAPADPSAACGVDPTPDDLTCEGHAACGR